MSPDHPWRRLRHRLPPDAGWVRDDERLWLVLPGQGLSLGFTGAEAQLGELWLQGTPVARALEQVGWCQDLPPSAVENLMIRLLDRIESVLSPRPSDRETGHG